MKSGVYGVYSVSECPDTLQYKRKKIAKTAGRRRGTRKGNGATGRKPTTTAVGSHHGQAVAAIMARGVHHDQTVVATGCGCPVCPRAPRFGLVRCFALGRGFCYSWGILGLLQASFDPHSPYFLAWIHLKHFSLKLGLNHRNLQ